MKKYETGDEELEWIEMERTFNQKLEAFYQAFKQEPEPFDQKTYFNPKQAPSVYGIDVFSVDRNNDPKYYVE